MESHAWELWDKLDGLLDNYSGLWQKAFFTIMFAQGAWMSEDAVNSEEGQLLFEQFLFHLMGNKWGLRRE